MKSTQLKLRCFGELKDGQWSVVCVDLCLAAQSPNLEKARNKLQLQVKEYLQDALGGQDSQYFEQLISRKAPISLMAKYYWIKFQADIHHHKERAKSILFTQSMPLRPC